MHYVYRWSAGYRTRQSFRLRCECIFTLWEHKHVGRHLVHTLASLQNHSVRIAFSVRVHFFFPRSFICIYYTGECVWWLVNTLCRSESNRTKPRYIHARIQSLLKLYRTVQYSFVQWISGFVVYGCAGVRVLVPVFVYVNERTTTKYYVPEPFRQRVVLSTYYVYCTPHPNQNSYRSGAATEFRKHRDLRMRNVHVFIHTIYIQNSQMLKKHFTMGRCWNYNTFVVLLNAKKRSQCCRVERTDSLDECNKDSRAFAECTIHQKCRIKTWHKWVNESHAGSALCRAIAFRFNVFFFLQMFECVRVSLFMC